MAGQVDLNMKYPILQIDLNKVYHNVKCVVDLCKSRGISVAGVVKGFNGLPRVAEQFIHAGCDYIADSRMDQIIELKNQGYKVPMMLIRIPMFSEIKDLVNYVDISLNSEEDTLKRIERECEIQGREHGVVLMYDLGDLREGVIEEEEFIKLALFVENELKHVKLMGVGTNLGCYGSIKPTGDNLGKLCTLAEKIENLIGRKLEIISGGATSSLPLIIDGKMPERINNLRIGEGIILAKDLEDFWGYDMKFMNQDAFVLKAQVVEIKNKPTHPIGEIFIDAFGFKPVYEDNGVRRRALLAVGKQDFGYHDKLVPLRDGVKIVGSSSDHLIIDIEDCADEIRLGEVLEFTMYYAPMLYLSGCSSVTKVFV